jgi:hypothetical protein
VEPEFKVFPFPQFGVTVLFVTLSREGLPSSPCAIVDAELCPCVHSKTHTNRIAKSFTASSANTRLVQLAFSRNKLLYRSGAVSVLFIRFRVTHVGGRPDALCSILARVSASLRSSLARMQIDS